VGKESKAIPNSHFWLRHWLLQLRFEGQQQLDEIRFSLVDELLSRLASSFSRESTRFQCCCDCHQFHGLLQQRSESNAV